MPWGLKRFQQSHQLHFLTFSQCYRRRPNFGDAKSRATFEAALERVRQQYALYVYGYVVMPEHVHLLVNEPEQGKRAQAMLAPELNEAGGEQPPEHSENPAELRSAWAGEGVCPHTAGALNTVRATLRPVALQKQKPRAQARGSVQARS